ncbi:MAG: HAMP domain-containing sensor histidine kinase [Sediminibacterium sp.]
MSAIYYLYFNYREEEFFKRIESEGRLYHDIVSQIKDPDQTAISRLLSGVRTNSLPSERLAVFDSTGKLIHKLPDSIKLSLDKSLQFRLLKTGVSRFKIGDFQYVASYTSDTKLYTVSTAYDLYGYSKLQNLKLILSIVFAGGMFVTWLFSFFFVQQAFKPLLAWTDQIKQTTIQSLKGRLQPIKNYPEMNAVAASFNAMMDRLSRGFEFQRSFVQQASHELRTPLAIMLSQTESALNHQLNAEQYRVLLASLKEDQQYLIALTNSLLALSQYEQLQFQKDWPEIRIDELVVEATSQLMQMYPDAQVNVGFKEMPESDKAFIVKGNDALLKSAFLNLLKNAYVYSSDKKISVLMSALNEQVLVMVENMGQTLSQEEAQMVMEPFFRGKNAINANTKGFGLGLSIVVRILLAHHARIEYHSPAVNDNQFTVVLPQSND